MKHLTARPDLSMLPEPYRTIVARALAKDPNQRPEPGLRPAPARGRPADARASGSSARARRAGAGRRPGRRTPAAEADDVLRIEAEEPVFYIGPDTRPPQPRQTSRTGSGPTGTPCGGRSTYRRPAAAAARPQARPRPQPRPQPGDRAAAPRRAAAAGSPAPVRRRRPSPRPCPAAACASPSWPPRCSGRPPGGPPGAPRRGGPGRRPGERPPAARLPLRHGPAGDLGRPDPEQALRGPDRSTRPPAG